MKRFWEKVEVMDTDSCWLWKAGMRGDYGLFYFNGKKESAHRVSYLISIGKIPYGGIICHKCDNKLCVNPNHLYVGTYFDNWKDAVDKGITKIPTKESHKHLIKHPSRSAYERRGCRCKECVALKREHNKKVRNKKTTEKRF